MDNTPVLCDPVDPSDDIDTPAVVAGIDETNPVEIVEGVDDDVVDAEVVFDDDPLPAAAIAERLHDRDVTTDNPPTPGA